MEALGSLEHGVVRVVRNGLQLSSINLKVLSVAAVKDPCDTIDKFLFRLLHFKGVLAAKDLLTVDAVEEAFNEHLELLLLLQRLDDRVRLSFLTLADILFAVGEELQEVDDDWFSNVILDTSSPEEVDHRLQIVLTDQQLVDLIIQNQVFLKPLILRVKKTCEVH